MTSIEFVIWMRGFMASSPYGSDAIAAMKKQLALVDGMPLPAEERATLISPRPVRHDYTDLVAEFGFHQFVELVDAVLDKNWPADIFTGESGDPGATFIVAVRQAIRELSRYRQAERSPA